MPHSRTDNSTLGVLLMSLAAFLWVLHDAISKWVMQDYSIYQVLLLRTVFSLLPIAIVLRHEGGMVRLRKSRAWVCLGRGCLAVACFMLFLAALPLMPLTDIFAIVMSAPLLITALSAPLLKEPVGFRRWMAVLVGFSAVLVMVRPGGDIDPLAALLVMGSVITYAFAMILTRRLGSTESAGAMTFFSALVFLAVGLIAAPFSWTQPTLIGLLLMAATGLLAGSAQYCLTEAFRIAPPSVIAPFEYTSLLWAMLFGFLVWGDVPTLLVLVSAAVVIASGIYVLHDEKSTRRRNRVSPVSFPPGS
ncbi:MAG: DMT family transporter [Deltaproteobacteria bacterium]|nr:DMT family transporter [Deltaproteobacteria bacterium]MBW2691979.1 DMT family transporter [Deltaproteobacteria bacterium]